MIIEQGCTSRPLHDRVLQHANGRQSSPLVGYLFVLLGLGAFASLPGASAQAAELSTRDVTMQLHQAKPGQPPAFTDMDLSFMDLAGLDFKGADLTGADLYGSDLTGANLIGANLSETRLDRATLIRTNFSEANLEEATLLRPNIFATLAFSSYDVARFTNARLVNARLIGFFKNINFRGADLTDADFSPLRDRPDTIGTVGRTQMTAADFTGAVARSTNFTQAVLDFSTFVDADLTGANFKRANLTRANFAGADVTGANFTDAIIDGANLTGVKGLETAKGLNIALSGLVKDAATDAEKVAQ